MARRRVYRTEYARRQARARAEGYRSYSEKRAVQEHQQVPSYDKLNKKQQGAWHRAFQALTQMEKGDSMRRAAQKAHTTPGVVRKYMGDRLVQRKRRWVPSDEYIKSQALKVRIVTEDGFKIVMISDARTRSEYAEYLSYVGMSFSGDHSTRQRGLNGLDQYKGRTFKDRSEERRVGKECRSRWSPYH